MSLSYQKEKRGVLIIDQCCHPHAEQEIRHKHELLQSGGG